jgi:hypothetical protein
MIDVRRRSDRGWRRRWVSERKNTLVEGNMARDIDTLSWDVIAAISLVFGSIANKNARKRSWG